MSDLPKLMQADCGHFIPADSPPSGQRHDPLRERWLPVYLCGKCQPGRQVQPEVKALRAR